MMMSDAPDPNQQINQSPNVPMSPIDGNIHSNRSMMNTTTQNCSSRWIPRLLLLVILIMASLSAIFTVSINRVYNTLNEKMIDLTTAEEGDSERHDAADRNITLRLNNMSDVADELIKIRTKLFDQEDEVNDLRDMIRFQLNTTVKELNNTVNDVKQDVQEQVQAVNDNVQTQTSLMAYQFAGTFAILGTLISIWHALNHIRKLHEPMIQRKIIAILWMIPIYSVTSWFGLIFVKATPYLALIKDIYEAYIIYTFLSFLIAVLGRGNREAVINLLAQNPEHLKSPIKFLFWTKRKFPTARHKAEAVLDQCQIFCMQFVFLRPVTTIAIIILDAVHESSWDYRYPQFYIMWIVNISIFFAFTGLVRFYHAVQHELNWCHPFAKFLCIKGVVFMTFWQGIVITVIANSVYASTETDGFDANEWSKEAQSFLICLEMFLFAIVHCFTFPTEEWEPGYRQKEQRRIKAKFGDNLALRDFVRDVKIVMTKKKNRKIVNDSDGNKDPGGDFALVKQDLGNDDDDIDIDWSNGWSRIEQYINVVEECEEELKLDNDVESSSYEGGDIV
jgi:ElaB/YqjD/DUF883 family membrane-anchored ribosome-binding protein